MYSAMQVKASINQITRLSKHRGYIYNILSTCTYIVGKYEIVLKRVQINFNLTDNVHILCLSCNVKKSKTAAKLD
jgi:hypothetical protein